MLIRCGLEHLIPRLDHSADWSNTLSGGEQQRAAFVRVLLNPPDILIMDEPTSALDELSQFKLLEYMRDDLADTTVLHVAHRPGLEGFHTRELRLVESGTGAATTQDVAYHPGLTMLRRVWFLWRRGSNT
jgi:putative ATP-binding cassette transporter